MKFCMNMYLDNRTNPIDFRVIGQSHRTGLYDFSPLRDRAKKLVDTIIHEQLCSAWWNFLVLRTCTLTTSRTLLNCKVISQKSRSHVFGVFCVRYTTATRGQHLALRKAWWPSLLITRFTGLRFPTYFKLVCSTEVGGSVAQWVGHWLVIERSRVRLPACLLPSNNSGQVVHTHVPLSPSSIIWYRPKGGDALQPGR